jgi:carbon monoxide dehydrogenase subunit G
MELTGEYRIPAPREKVWQALNDPNVLQRCIPGCESVEKLSDTEFTAKVVLKIGPMTAKFSGKGTLSDLDPPNGYTITGEGQGGVAGFGKGSAKVRLEADGAETTVMRYTAETQVGGKMAQLGARLIDSTSKKLADQFFDRFAAAVSGPPPSPEEVPEMAGATPEPKSAGAAVAPTAAATTDGQRLKPTVWIPILIAVVAIVLWWFTRT